LSLNLSAPTRTPRRPTNNWSLNNAGRKKQFKILRQPCSSAHRLLVFTTAPSVAVSSATTRRSGARRYEK
jgi:hypothetical protein